MVITQWIIQINFFTGCMIISLVPAGYANLSLACVVTTT